jgi:hypothetical protein
VSQASAGASEAGAGAGVSVGAKRVRERALNACGRAELKKRLSDASVTQEAEAGKVGGRRGRERSNRSDRDAGVLSAAEAGAAGSSGGDPPNPHARPHMCSARLCPPAKTCSCSLRSQVQGRQHPVREHAQGRRGRQLLPQDRRAE